MSFKKFIVIISCIWISSIHFIIAQTETDGIIEQIIESVMEDAGEDFDYSESVERLSYYVKNPINLNKASADQLQELIFLSPIQINAILDYRDKNGTFIDLLELQSIESLDLEIVKNLLPFVTLASLNPLSGLSAKDILNEAHHDLIIRYGQILEKQQGFLIPDSNDRSRYLGSPQRLFVRYRYNYAQHIFISLNMEKDAGERFFSGSQAKGFDFYSANLFLRDIGKIRKIAIGDYVMQFGQGLTLWTGLGFGKGAAISTITKPDLGLRPYSSANEALFFRGVATTINLRKIQFTPFISYRSLDGSLSTASVQSGEEIKSLSQTGFHRTLAELKNRNTIRQLVYGINLQYSSRNLNIGFAGYKTNFNHTLAIGQSVYSKFNFSGRSLVNAGVYYNRTWRNMYFFGELAHSFDSGFAYMNGVLASLSSQVSLVMLHRDYQKTYHSFYSQAIAEGGNSSNEKGLYSGLIFAPVRNTELAVYADFFRFPWLKFRVDAPSAGHEIYSQFTWTLKKKLKAIIRYKLEEKEQNNDADAIINFIETVRKQNFRAEVSYKISDDLQLRNRLEIAAYKKGEDPSELGYMVLQDVIYNPMQSRFSGNIRFAIFDTSGYNSRVYVYENDVLYSYAVPALQNTGLRFYVNGRYTVKRGIDIWLKYGITKYTDVEEIGSGLDMINGNTRSDIKVQLRFQF